MNEGNTGFYEVCEECGRHVFKAGHADDCPNADDGESD